MTNVNDLDERYSISDFMENIEPEEKKIKKLLSDFETKDKKNNLRNLHYLNDEVLQMIDHIDGRVQYWENRRNQFLPIALGLLGASLAGILSLIPEIDKTFNNVYLIDWNIVFLPLAISLISIIVGSIRLVWVWNLQNNPNYPFTKGYRVWRWHYRSAEQEGKESEVDIGVNDEEKYLAEVKKYQKNLINYKKLTIKSNFTELLNQNISQVYLVIVNEKYKIKYVSELRNTLINCLQWALISFPLSLVLYLLIK